MRERLLVLALAAAALGLFYVIFFPKPQPTATDVVFPLSTEGRPDGYLALWRWLDQQRVPEASLRYRYDRLAALAGRPDGNLLIMTLPQRIPGRRAELAELTKWVQAGNTLLILAALDDRPLWALAGDPLAQQKLQELTGLKIEVGGVGADATALAGVAASGDISALQTAHLDIVPRGEHPLLAGVRHITAVSMPAKPHGPPQGRDEVLPLELADRADGQGTTLWLLRRGAGQIILSTVASPFSNRAAALDDNARLIANMVAWCCGHGGTVVFDDAHQGAIAYYDANAFFADPRLHRTLGWIVLLWLAFVLGALPLRVAQRVQQPLDEGLYIEASARYLAAVVSPPEAAQRLIERFLEGPRGGGITVNGQSLWERLDSHPHVTAAQRRSLHTLYEKACSGSRVDLARLQNLLAQLRGILD
jgi:hypothetical protein